MITWKNGEPVHALMSHNFESLKLQLNRFNPKTGQLEFIDKHGFKHYTYRKFCKFILPPYWIPTERISDLMLFKESDYFE